MDRNPRVQWDFADMTTICGTAVGVYATREEVCLLFAGRMVRTGGRETVMVSDRIIVNPFTAKRLHVLLENILARQELRSPERSDMRALMDSRN